MPWPEAYSGLPDVFRQAVTAERGQQLGEDKVDGYRAVGSHRRNWVPMQES